jgi:lysophospholipase L1-like esterase
MKSAARVVAVVSTLALTSLGGCSSGGGGGAPDGAAGAGGGGGGGGDGADSMVEGGADGPASTLISRANPLISRGKPVFSMPGNGAVLVDQYYHNGGWTVPSAMLATTPAWAAINLGAGPTRILVSWDDGGTYNYQDPNAPAVYGLPGKYHLDVSPDSTNGSDGTWTTAVSVGDPTLNQVRTRAHAVDFTGMAWVKMVITAAAANESPNGVQIAAIDVHDLSATGAAGLPDDTWFFMGDSITAFAYDRAQTHQPSFAEAVHAATPAFFPAMINGGIGGERSADGLARLQQALALNPDFRFFVLGYGTNDAANAQVPVATYKATMQTMIDAIKAAGRIPIVPHIPFSGDGAHGAIPSYNTAVDELTQTNQLPTGADLYGYLMQNAAGDFPCPPCGAGRTTDNLHPNDTGLAAMNTLWAQTARPLYP